MMILLGWLAALAAMVTSLAMLSDTPLSAEQRAHWRFRLRMMQIAYQHGGPAAVDVAELSRLVRFFLRLLLLVVIVASSGVCVLFPFGAGAPASAYDVALRCALVAFMAMQAPCPWWRYIVFGVRCPASRAGKAGDRHVH